jgi:enamine deaminase RidA (YjgF/YER057c/UK114 family)
MLFLSGTSAVDENGATVHAGDFAAQCLRTYRNLTRLLETEGASWRDVVRTTCYLRDMDRDYAAFNRLRTAFLASHGISPLPASTAIEARLCRPDLLIEIEAIAMVASRGPQRP